MQEELFLIIGLVKGVNRMDSTLIVSGIIGLLLIVGVVFYFISKANKEEVKQFDASSQDEAIAASKNESAHRGKGGALKANTAKTAQLSALRERIDLGGKKHHEKPIGMPVSIAKPIVDEAKPSVESSWSPDESGFSSSFQVKPDWTTEEGQNKRSSASTRGSEPVQTHEAHMPIEPTREPRVSLISESSAHLPTLNPSNPIVPEKNKIIADQILIPPLLSEGHVSTDNWDGVVPVIKQKVLLVDDSKVVRIKTEKLLTGGGYEVLSAIDGIDALSKLENFNPDLIVTDIEMPNLDGFGLVRNIRNNDLTREIPIIVMTSHVNLHLDIAATEGINGFLPKPFNEQDLLDQVAFLVDA